MGARLTYGKPGARTEAIVKLQGEGLSRREVADRLGCSIGTVNNLLSRYRERMGLAAQRRGRPPKVAYVEGSLDGEVFAPGDEIDDMSGERCRCGLRLPCNDCLPASAAAYAQDRRDVPEGARYTMNRRAGE